MSRFRTPNLGYGQGQQQLADGVGRGMAAIFGAPLAEAQAFEAAELSGMKRQLMQSQIAENMSQAAVRKREEEQLGQRPGMLALMGASKAGMSLPEFQAGLNERTYGAPMEGPPVLSPEIPGLGPSGRTQNFDDVVSMLYAPAMATPADKLNWDQLAKARGEYQDQDVVRQGMAAIGLKDDMRLSRINALRGKKEFSPFKAVGNTGTALNEITGAQPVSSPALNLLFNNEGQSRITENKAQANSANASAGSSSATRDWTNARKERTVQGLDKPVTIIDDDTGEASVTTLPTQGEPVVRGLAPKKSTGTDATNAKARNRVIEAVEKEMPGAPDAEVSAEVERRMARRTGAAPAPKPNDKTATPAPVAANNATANSASTSLPQQARAALKEGVKTTFKNGQSWTLRNGQPVQVN